MTGLLRISESGGLLRVYSGEVALAAYDVDPRVPEADCPKPYLHPVRTLAGQVVTAVRPEDHTWHNGLQFAMAQLSGENFWGGRTYVRGRGYVPLDNNGTVSHLRWDRVECDGDRATLCHELAWVTASGQKWLYERRSLEFGDVDPAAGRWTLGWRSHLRNTSGHELRWGSPVTEGRSTAGYGGLFWRGPRSFTGGSVRTSDGVAGEAAMGHQAPWLAFTGGGDDGRATLLFVDSTANHGYPTAWYVRADPFPVVSFAATYHRAIRLAPDEELTLHHHLVVIDGEWDDERLAAMASAQLG